MPGTKRVEPSPKNRSSKSKQIHNFIIKFLQKISSNIKGKKFNINNLKVTHPDSDFVAGNLENSDFKGFFLKGKNFQHANLINADFTDAYLEGANFQNANLTNANFQNANIQGSNFKLANLTQANLKAVETGLTRTGNIILLVITLLLSFASAYLIFNVGSIESLLTTLQNIPNISNLETVIQELNIYQILLLAVNLSIPFIILFTQTWMKAFIALAICNLANSIFIYLIFQPNIFWDLTVDNLNTFIFIILSNAIFISFILGVFITAIAIALILSLKSLIHRSLCLSVWLFCVLGFVSTLLLINKAPTSLEKLIINNIFTLLLLIFASLIAIGIYQGKQKYYWIKQKLSYLTSYGSTNFSKANLSYTNFENANLKNANFTHSYLYNTHFARTKNMNSTRFSIKNNVVILNLKTSNFDASIINIISFIWTKKDIYPIYFQGTLPKNKNIINLGNRWNKIFARKFARNYNPTIDIEQVQGRLDQEINEWLKFEGFSEINQILLEKFQDNDELKLIIQCPQNEIYLRIIPWHLWNFIKFHHNREIVINIVNNELISPTLKQDRVSKISQLLSNNNFVNLFNQKKPNILVNLGVNTERNYQKHQELLTPLTNKLSLLMEPTNKEFMQAINSPKKQSWDIIFFNEYKIYQSRNINNIKLSKHSPNYTVKALNHTLKIAVTNKTKLLILNTSKSWELAEELTNLSIPMIIFQHPIPYYISPMFLSSLVQAINTNKPLYLALKEAKRNLQQIEPKFSYLSYFPLLIENIN